MISKDEFEEILNECYPEIMLFGRAFGQGELVRKMDPIAFEHMYKDFINQQEAEHA